MKVRQRVRLKYLPGGLDHGYGGSTGVVSEVEPDGRALIEIRTSSWVALLYAYDRHVDVISDDSLSPLHPSPTVRLAARLLAARLKVPHAQ